MSLLKRLRNLWALSSYELPSSQEEDARNHKRIELIRSVLTKHKMAKIIEPQEEIFNDIPTQHDISN